MAIFTLFFSLSWLQILNLPAFLQNKNTRMGPFPWKRSVLQNPHQERTNQSTEICLELGLPYNKNAYFQVTFSSAWPSSLLKLSIIRLNELGQTFVIRLFIRL